MTDIEPRFFDTENKVMAYLEWEALRVLHFRAETGETRMSEMLTAFPEYDQRFGYWADAFTATSKLSQRECLRKIRNREFNGLDEFYEEAKKLLKPIARGKALKDKKKRTSQEAFQRERLGDAFIENKALLKESHEIAFKLVEENAEPEAVSEAVAQLLFNHGFANVTDKQIATLFEYVQAQMDKHNLLDRTEAAIIDTNDKNIVFMWCKIKRKYPKGSTFTWTTIEGAAEAKCSKSNVGPIMKRLEKLGAITLIQAGRAGKNSSRAALYRREV